MVYVSVSLFLFSYVQNEFSFYFFFYANFFFLVCSQNFFYRFATPPPPFLKKEKKKEKKIGRKQKSLEIEEEVSHSKTLIWTKDNFLVKPWVISFLLIFFLFIVNYCFLNFTLTIFGYYFVVLCQFRIHIFLS